MPPSTTMPPRAYLIEWSVIVEKELSYVLCRMLSIKNPSTSKSFGYESSASSFNSKLSLLIDIDAIDTTVRAKLIKFGKNKKQICSQCRHEKI